MCCNLPLSKMLQNYCFTYPQKKKRAREERKHQNCQVFYFVKYSI